MFFANCTDKTEITRTGKPGVTRFFVDEDLENGTRAQFYMDELGALRVGPEGKVAPAEMGYVPENASGIASLNVGGLDEIFAYGEDREDTKAEPLIWVLTESILLANNIRNELSVVLLDDYMLVCLRRGAMEVQTSEDGDTMPLTRGIKKKIEEMTTSGASSGDFLGLPKEDTRTSNSVLTVDLTRKHGKYGYDVSCRVIPEASGLLDLGVYKDQDDVAEAEREAAAQERQERATLREAAEARALAAQEEEARKRDSVVKSVGGRGLAKARTETTSTGRNIAASEFLASITNG